MSTALVTGGTSGIGLAFARELASRKHDIVLVARDSARLAEVSQELALSHGVAVETITADLADRSQVELVAERLRDSNRPVDILVNNAGFGLNANLLESDTSLQETAMDVMATAVLILSAAGGKGMVERGHGQIINVGSVSAWIVKGNYSAIKRWVITYTEALARELQGTGVGATVVCPGWVKTELHQRAGVRRPKLPKWAWLEPEEVAQTALKDADAGRIISIPKWQWKIAVSVLKIAPASFPRFISGVIARSRGNK